MWDTQNSGNTTAAPVGFTLKNGRQYGWNVEANVDGIADSDSTSTDVIFATLLYRCIS
jgi:hypothetical protein